MKGKYVFDVKNIPEISQLVIDKAVGGLGCKDMLGEEPESGPFGQSLLFVDLEASTIKASGLDYADYKNKYGFGGYSTELSVVQFLRLEAPVPQVALALVITDDMDKANEVPPRMITAADLNNFKFKVTRDNVMEAAEQACSALGV